jgi:hypothetical protein
MSAVMMHQSGDASDFSWAQIAPSEHFVQIYAADSTFLDSLEAFVAAGLRNNEAVIVIITPIHRISLELRLRTAGFDLGRATEEDRYIVLDAARTLGRFIMRGWPDEILFRQVVEGLLERAGKDGRRVRAFGEMVVLLWDEGHTGATICLERLWHSLCQERSFPLFCAYPQASFDDVKDLSARQICAAHSKVIAG